MGLCLELRGQTIGSTNHKDEPLVTELFESSREGNRRQGLALLHESDQGFVWP